MIICSFATFRKGLDTCYRSSFFLNFIYPFFQTASYQNAASAAFTNLVYNPSNEIMRENLDYYIDKTGAEREQLVNFESKVL